MAGRSLTADSRRGSLLPWAISAAMGGFAVGYQLAVISGALLFIRREFGLTSFEQGVLVGSLLIAAMFGGLLAAPMADAFGRRHALLIEGAVFVAGTLLAVVAPSFVVIVLARAIVGLAVGAVSSTAPLYLSEVASPRVRGRLVTLNQLMVTLGIVAAYGVGLAFSSSGSWRAMFAVALFPTAALLIGMLRAPETPAWLDAHGRSDEARDVLLQVVDETECERILDGVRQQRAEQRKQLRVGQLPRSPAAPALVIGVVLAVAQQFAGINAVIAYAPTIAQASGFGTSNAILTSVVLGAVNVAATVFCLRRIDDAGRRPLMLASSAGTFASLALLGLAFEVSLGAVDRWVSLIALLTYIAAFAIGLGPIFWLLIAEIFPPEARAAGASVATAVNWFSSFVVGLVFLPIADAIGQGPTFWIFAGVCAFAFVFVRRYVPETKGRTFTEIDAALRERFKRR